MESRELYNKLKNDFIKEGITDLDWAAPITQRKNLLP